jgi:hypothetical protein
MDLVNRFWYLIHVERVKRNGNSIGADFTEDSIENDYNDVSFGYFHTLWQLFLDILTLEKKLQYTTLS